MALSHKHIQPTTISRIIKPKHAAIGAAKIVINKDRRGNRKLVHVTSTLSSTNLAQKRATALSYGSSGNKGCTRVSNELGAGHPRAACLAVCVVLVMAITEGILVGLVLVLIRNIWGFAYSNEIEVIRYVAAMLPILATLNFMDRLQSVLSGTVRGCGRQKMGAFINLGSYYLVGIPMSILLAFVLHVGGKGLWLGILCALLVQVAGLFSITLRTNWEQEAQKAKERVYTSAIPVEILS